MVDMITTLIISRTLCSAGGAGLPCRNAPIPR